ncbi:MAG TPA: hypothetical protein VFA19_16240 [Gaiellaceae bacterium]|nr:hypothetical protein [Gaiellaceae bacterium]
MSSQARQQKPFGITEDARNELLAKIDEAVDDSPKGRALKRAVKDLPSADRRRRADGGTRPEREAAGQGFEP